MMSHEGCVMRKHMNPLLSFTEILMIMPKTTCFFPLNQRLNQYNALLLLRGGALSDLITLTATHFLLLTLISSWHLVGFHPVKEQNKAV